MCLNWKLSEGKGVLQDLFESQEKTTLFPDDRLEYDWVPFRPIVSNLDQVWNNLCLTLYSRDVANKQLLTIGNCYKVPRGVKCNISLYGDESSESLPGHLARYMKLCLELAKECIEDVVNCTLLLVHPGDTNSENVSIFLNQCSFLQQNLPVGSMFCIEEDL